MNLTSDLTTNEALGAGVIAGSVLSTILVFAIIFYILTVIASWKIFVKAGEPGWKSLIPIYNVYIMYKISNLSFLYWLIIPAIAMGIISAIGNSLANETLKSLFTVISSVIEIVIYAKFSSALSKAFGKGTGFAVGLFFFPNIFQLILGFGSAKYVGNK